MEEPVVTVVLCVVLKVVRCCWTGSSEILYWQLAVFVGESVIRVPDVGCAILPPVPSCRSRRFNVISWGQPWIRDQQAIGSDLLSLVLLNYRQLLQGSIRPQALVKVFGISTYRSQGTRRSTQRRRSGALGVFSPRAQTPDFSLVPAVADPPIGSSFTIAWHICLFG